MKRSRVFILFVFFLFLIACRKNRTEQDNSEVKEPTKPNWYKVTEIVAGTHIIEEPNSSQRNVCYLIEGSNKAYMIDTGAGEGPVFENTRMMFELEDITSLPITLVQSHFHFDHNQNIGEFENIAFPDLQFLRDLVDDQNNYNFSQQDLFEGMRPVSIKVTEWLPLNEDLDLGNRTIQFINIPGHTDESVALIDKTNKHAFLGDFLYNGELFMFDHEDFTKYEISVNYLLDNLSDGYRLFGAHGSPEMNYDKLSQLKSLLECISSKQCEAKPDNVWGRGVDIYTDNNLTIVLFK